MTWHNSVSMQMGRVVGPDANTVVHSVPQLKASAIDNFYASTSSTLTKINPAFIATYGHDMAGLLFVGLISATENYFRDILGLILSICPRAQAHAADEKVQLGSLLWAEDHLRNRSAFEFMAFSSADNIRKTVSNFACHQVRQNGSFDFMLKEFDKLCELRHAVVHSGHLVAGKNAIKLGLKRSTGVLRVQFEYADLQVTGSVCTALIQAANNELYETLVGRWAEDWRKLPGWDKADETKLFTKLLDGFTSTRDKANGTIGNAQSSKRLLGQVRTAFNLK